MQVFGLTVENFFVWEEKMDQYLNSDMAENYLDFLGEVTDLISAVALYITIALAVGLIIYAIVIRNRDEQYLAGARKLMAGMISGYAVGVISVLGSYNLARDVWKGDLNTNWWLMAGMFALAAVGLVVVLVLWKKKPAAAKWTGLGFGIALVAYSVVLLFVVKPEQGYEPITSKTLMYVLSAIVIAVIAVLAFLGGSENKQYNTKALTYGAICIALSFALSYIKFFQLPQHGSVTFASLLPLALYSYMFGTKKGVIAGIIYGFLQFIQSPSFYEPMQALLDYPIAFAAIGVAGIARKFAFLKGDVRLEFAVGTTIAVLLRYVSHVISGYFVFYSLRQEGYSPLTWAFVYNLFTIVDLVIVLVMGVLVLLSRQVRWMVLTADSAPELQTANN